MHEKTIHMVTFTLLAIGGINWLLVGLFEFNLVTMITSYLGTAAEMIERVIYIAVGASAIYEIMMRKKIYKMGGDSATHTV